VETARRVLNGRHAKVISEGQIESIFSCRGHLNQPDFARVFQDFLNQADLQPLLRFTQEDGHLDGSSCERRQIDFLDVLEIDEDVMHGAVEFHAPGFAL